MAPGSGPSAGPQELFQDRSQPASGDPERLRPLESETSPRARLQHQLAGLDQSELHRAVGGQRWDAGLKGWTSTGAVSIPDGKHVRYWVERIEAGASRPLPKISWRFPDGTVFTDILSHAGKVFEVRQLTRTAKGWIAATPYKVEGGPPGYHGPGKKCSECHDRAGGWEQYGSLIRGSDGIFSFPLLEGYDDAAKTITAGKWPLKHWNE